MKEIENGEKKVSRSEEISAKNAQWQEDNPINLLIDRAEAKPESFLESEFVFILNGLLIVILW